MLKYYFCPKVFFYIAMPTFREDLHLGHKVPTIETDDITDGAITEGKMADGSVSTRVLQDGCVTEPKLGDGAVSERTIQDGAVTEPKLADGSVSHRTIQPEAVDGSNIKPGSIESKHLALNAVETWNINDKAVTPQKLSDGVQAAIVLPITDQIDAKFTNITNEQYNMIASLQVGGIALSDQLGDREDIGISQKALTKLIGKIWEAIEDPEHHVFDFVLNVVPDTSFKEDGVTVSITCDSTGAISNFDDIKVYVDDVLIAESSDLEVFTTSAFITHTSVIKAVGTIIGKVITKTKQAVVEIPFFMGSGQNYQDVMNMDCHKELIGTLEGNYDVTVKRNGDYMFIIIPISHRDEFRRADMNGLGLKVEIPLNEVVYDDFVVYKSANTYKAGTYNIDIDINS